MTTKLSQHVAVCLLIVAVVKSQNTPTRNSGGYSGPGGPSGPGGYGGSFRCPDQTNGRYEFSGNCRKFYDCTGGVATPLDCPLQLVFNPAAGFCDWPVNVPNANCAGSEEDILTPETRNLCSLRQERPDQAYKVAHPFMCNAFHTCSDHYLHPWCEFCAGDMIVNQENGQCIQLPPGEDPTTVCNSRNRQFIPHDQKTVMTLSCWPYAKLPNPMQLLFDMLRSGNIQRPTNRPG